MEQVEIYVAAHKPVSLSLPEGYRICQVNAAKNGRWQGEYAHDDDGEDNISFKNDRFSELTALYALWKNSRADIKGLAHYRRFFSAQDAMTPRNILFRTILPGDMPGAILGEEKIREYLGSADIIMEYPRFPIYCTAREDLLRFVFPEDIREMRELISREYPDYLNSCERVLRSTNISYLNMFAAKKEISDAYCQWLFSFLGKLEDRLGRVENYDAQHKRIFGYLGEVLLNVWALKNAMRIKYVCSVQLLENYKYGENSVKAKGLRAVKKHLLVPLSLCRAYDRMKYDNIRRSAREPYSVTLDDVCPRFHAPEDVLEYYRRFPIGKAQLRKADVGAGEAEYVCFLVEEVRQYQYPQSNSRCLVTLFADDTDAVSALVKAVRAEYEKEYTVTFRVLTGNADALAGLEDEPDISVFSLG